MQVRAEWAGWQRWTDFYFDIAIFIYFSEKSYVTPVLTSLWSELRCEMSHGITLKYIPIYPGYKTINGIAIGRVKLKVSNGLKILSYAQTPKSTS